MRRNDLTTLRPWTARPSRMGDSAWEVVAPPRHGKEPMLIGSMLSEEDARLIAAAPDLLRELEDLIGYIAEARLEMSGAIGLSDARAAIDRATGEDFDPVAEDEAHARMETDP